MCRNVLLLFCLPPNVVVNKWVCAVGHGLFFIHENLKTQFGTSFTAYFITSLDFLKLFNNLAYEFMSVLWYCHQKEDQNSDWNKWKGDRTGTKSVWNKEVTFIIQSTTPVGNLHGYHINHDGIGPLMKDHCDGKQVVSMWNEKPGTIMLAVSVQAAEWALCVIRHLPLLPEVELSARKIGWDFLW